MTRFDLPATLGGPTVLRDRTACRDKKAGFIDKTDRKRSRKPSQAIAVTTSIGRFSVASRRGHLLDTLSHQVSGGLSCGLQVCASPFGSVLSTRPKAP